MTPPPDIHTLTGVYAVDALPDDEREQFEAHLQVCEACRQEVDELRATAALLAEPVAETPPASLRERVLAGADQQRQVPPRTTVTDLASRRRTPVWATALAGSAAAALLIAVIGLSFAVTSLTDRLDELEVAAGEQREQAALITDVLASPDAQVVSVAGEDGSVVNLVLSHETGRAVFVADGMEPAPHEHTYEMWVIHDDRAVPVGVFDPGPDGRVTHTVTGDLDRAVAIGVTIEPEGGSPEPTTDPVMLLEL